MARLVARSGRPIHFVRLAFVAASALAIAGACAPSTSAPSPGGVDASTPAAPAASEAHGIAASATKLVAPDAWLASMVAPTADGWTLVGAGYLSPGWRAADAHDNDGVGARFAATADAPFDVGLGQDPTRRATLTPVGASDARGSIHRGRVVFHDAYPSTDVVVGATRTRVEELLVLRDASAPTSFAWRLTLSSRMPTARMATDGSLEMTNAKGQVLLHVPRPYALDAAGVRRDAVLAYDGEVIRVALDATGLTFPVALDPAVETPLWSNPLPGTTGNPPARYAASMVFDSTNSNAVLFGGSASGATRNDTWTWNGSAWSEPCATCANASARNAAAMAFDSNSGRHVAVLFGGYNGAPLCDTLEWNGASSTWAIKSAPACPANNSGATPVARSASAMAFAGAQGVVMFSGGENLGTIPSDLWAYNGTSWTLLCNASPCNTTVPLPRNDHAMAYDSGRGRVVLFGGQRATSPFNYLADTWEWDGTQWTQMCTMSPCNTTVPIARGDHAMAYDANRKKVVLFGGWAGNSGVAAFGDTWEWDGTSWVQLEASNSTTPVARIQTAMAFDSVRKNTVLFSGSASNGTLLANGTWTYATYGDACTLASQCDTSLCLDGVCCTASCGACQICNGTSPGLCTNITNVEGPRCMTTQYCDGSSVCQTKLAAGVACTANLQCQSGLVCSPEGVCCNSACNSDGCHSCLAANTGGAAGSCLPVTAGHVALSGCAATAQSTCGIDGTCDGAGACRKWVSGTVCVAQSCSGTTQTNASTCNGSGTCNGNGTLACAAGYMCLGAACPTACSSDDTTGDLACASGFYCNGTMCVAKTANGTACTVRGGHCTNGNCNHDGVCCDAACNSACESCTQARKGSGADGVCGATAADTDPYSLCAPGSTTCGAPGKCDGVNQGTTGCLANAHNGVVCGATTCTNNLQSGLQCDGNGSCLSANNVPCAPYDCASAAACATTCTTIADCQQTGSGFFCDTAHHCTAKKTNGQSCGGAVECAMGNCVDGVCCDSPCGSQCAACNLAGKMGMCSPVTGAPVGTRTACSATGTTCGGACDGTNAAACGYPGSTKECGATCTGNSETLSTCDSTGTCKLGSAHNCSGNFVCDATTMHCKTACTIDADCASGFHCDASKCIPTTTITPTCDMDHTVVGLADGGTQDCTPYKCSGNQCSDTCASVDQCVAPNVCDQTNHCVPPPNAAAGSGDSGGCAMAPQSSRGNAWWLALVGIAVAVRRRRRVR